MYLFLHFFAQTCSANPSGSGLIGSGCLPKAQTTGNNNFLNRAFLIAFVIIGALAFLFLVIGGARYAMSQGNPETIQKAKNQILYSLIGLIIAAMAAAIVNYVVGVL